MQLQVDKQSGEEKMSVYWGWTMIYIKVWTTSIFSANSNTIVYKKSYFRTYQILLNVNGLKEEQISSYNTNKLSVHFRRKVV